MTTPHFRFNQCCGSESGSVFRRFLDPDPNWAEILDPDPNSMYLDPQHCLLVLNIGSPMEAFLVWATFLYGSHACSYWFHGSHACFVYSHGSHAFFTIPRGAMIVSSNFFLFKFDLFTFNSITGLTCGLALKQNFCLNFQKISLLQIATVCYRRADQLSHMMSAESLPSFVSNLVRMLSSWITWFPYDFQVED